MYLFIAEIINKDYVTIFEKLGAVGICWVLVLFGIVIDFLLGVSKAKEIGEFRSSEGYRRTVTKFKEYYSALFFALLFDSLLFVTIYFPDPIPKLPIVTILITVMLLFTEYRSMREKGNQKLRRKQNENGKELASLFTKITKEEGIKGLLEFLERQQDKQIENENNNNSTNRDDDI